MKFKRRYYYL